MFRTEAQSLSFLFFIFAVGIIFGKIYLDRPTVEVDIETGACLRAYGPKGPMACEQAQKGMHEVVHVDQKGRRSNTKKNT